MSQKKYASNILFLTCVIQKLGMVQTIPKRCTTVLTHCINIRDHRMYWYDYPVHFKMYWVLC